MVCYVAAIAQVISSGARDIKDDPRYELRLGARRRTAAGGSPRQTHRGGPGRDCGNREQRGARRPKPISIAPLRYWPAVSNDGMEAAMKTLAARMVLATSVALATLAAAETAYTQDYHSVPGNSNSFPGVPKTIYSWAVTFSSLDFKPLYGIFRLSVGRMACVGIPARRTWRKSPSPDAMQWATAPTCKLPLAVPVPGFCVIATAPSAPAWA